MKEKLYFTIKQQVDTGNMQVYSSVSESKGHNLHQVVHHCIVNPAIIASPDLAWTYFLIQSQIIDVYHCDIFTKCGQVKIRHLRFIIMLYYGYMYLNYS